jgi:alpha-ketoglutarate-dependent 2,4-dichlorophenoxyacetate dioxygenase
MPFGCDCVSTGNTQYGVLVCRNTGLDDDTHVAVSRMLGELDDVTPYNKLGRINRLKYDEWVLHMPA